MRENCQTKKMSGLDVLKILEFDFDIGHTATIIQLTNVKQFCLINIHKVLIIPDRTHPSNNTNRNRAEMEKIVIRMIIALAAIATALISGWIQNPKGVTATIMVLSSLTIIEQRDIYTRAWAMGSWRTILIGLSTTALLATTTAVASAGVGFLLATLVL